MFELIQSSNLNVKQKTVPTERNIHTSKILWKSVIARVIWNSKCHLRRNNPANSCKSRTGFKSRQISYFIKRFTSLNS